MSEYSDGAVDILAVMGLDAKAAVAGLMEELRSVQASSKSELEALQGKLEETKASHKAQLEVIDEVASRHTIRVKCRSCEEYYAIDWDLSLYDPQTSYCGKGEWCTP